MSKVNLQRIEVYQNLIGTVPAEQVLDALRSAVEEDKIKLVSQKELEGLGESSLASFIVENDLVKTGRPSTREGKDTLFTLVKTQHPSVAEIVAPTYDIAGEKLLVNRNGEMLEVWFAPLWRSKPVAAEEDAE